MGDAVLISIVAYTVLNGAFLFFAVYRDIKGLAEIGARSKDPQPQIKMLALTKLYEIAQQEIEMHKKQIMKLNEENSALREAFADTKKEKEKQMKILGYNEKDGQCIVSISKHEIANLCGLYSSYDDKFRDVFVLGKEIEVSKLYQDVRAFDLLKKDLDNLSEAITSRLLSLSDFIKAISEWKK